jgi:signal transduction histidine kinase
MTLAIRPTPARLDPAAAVHTFTSRVACWTDAAELCRAAVETLDALLGRGAARLTERGDAVLALIPDDVSTVLVTTPDGVWGTIRLASAASETAAWEARAVAAILAGQLGVALHAAERAAAEREEADAMRRRLKQAETLATLSEGFVRGKDLTRVLQRVVEGTTELMRCEISTVLLRHRSLPALEVVAATGGASRCVIGDVIPMDESLAGWVVKTGLPRMSMDPASEPLAYRRSGDRAGIRNHLIVPLRSDEGPIGVLTVSNRLAPGPFAGRDVELLGELARHAAAAIESSRVLDSLQRRVAENAALSQVGRAVTGMLALEDVLALLVREAEALIDGACACVALRTDEAESLRIAAATGVLARDEGQLVPLDGSLIGWVARNGESVATESLSADPRSQVRSERFGPAAAVPLMVGPVVRGALLVARSDGAPPIAPDDVEALAHVAAYAAIAIENSRLFRAQTEAADALRAQRAELERAYHDLGASQQQLLVSEKMAALGRITAGIAHEINSPLGGILNGLEIVRAYATEYRDSVRDPEVTADDHEAIAADMLEALALTETATRRVAQFVRSIKAQTRAGEPGGGGARFDAAAEVQSTLPLLDHHLRQRGITVEAALETGLVVAGDPGKFGLVVQNLVSNAADAYGGAAGSVALRLFRDDLHAVFEVEDGGSGIAEEIRGRVFDYLFTTKEIGRGTGLGLSTVHSIVTSHFRGEIAFRSQIGTGTCFVVRLPLATEAG